MTTADHAVVARIARSPAYRTDAALDEADVDVEFLTQVCKGSESLRRKNAAQAKEIETLRTDLGYARRQANDLRQSLAAVADDVANYQRMLNQACDLLRAHGIKP